MDTTSKSKADLSSEDDAEILAAMATSSRFTSARSKRERRKWSSDPEEDAELEALDASFKKKSKRAPARPMIVKRTPLPANMPSAEVKARKEMSKAEFDLMVENMIKEEVERIEKEKKEREQRKLEDDKLTKMCTDFLNENAERQRQEMRSNAMLLRQHFDMRNEYAELAETFFSGHPAIRQEMMDYLDEQWENTKSRYNYEILKKNGHVDF